MPWGRKSRFFSWLDSARQHQVTAAGDAESGLEFTGGGWAGVVNVNIYAVGNEDRVRITITNHPHDDEQRHCTELYAGPLEADKVYKEKRRLRRRRAADMARKMVRERLAKVNTALAHDLSEEDPFYLDESEWKDG